MIAGLKRTARRQNGFVLVAFTLALFMILGCVGLSFDIGRMYVTRNELQSFCDAAALAAVSKLNGTVAGLDAARNAAKAIPKGYQFGTTPIDAAHATINIDFAEQPPAATSPVAWAPNPTPSGVILVRVTASAPLPMAIIPVVTGVFTSSIAASAAAKQEPTGALNNIFPFTPYWMPPGYNNLPVKDLVNGNESTVPADPYGMVPARLGTDPEYTYQQGGIYTLRGPSSIDTKKNLLDADPMKSQMCQNDATLLAAGYREAGGSSDRGYISWDQSKSDIRKTILGNNTAPGDNTISVGDSVVSGCDFCLVNGTAGTEVDAIQERIGMDTTAGQAAYNYREYMKPVSEGGPGGGNGARVVVVPISTGLCGGTLPCPDYPAASGKTGTTGPNVVMGFAAIFCSDRSRT